MNVALHSESGQHVNLISLCTGGGGLDLGLELALPAARSVVMVEREAFAVAHLVAAFEQGLLAPAAIWSDVRTFDGRPWRGLVDGLVGGIPCQPHSMAGKKGGSLDERDLWSPTRRIIVQARPWFVVIENVGGMLSPGADEVAGAERVWRDLHKLGYAVEGGLFTAAEVGASHERERIIILGVADAIGDAFGRSDFAGGVQGPAETPEGEAFRTDGERRGTRSGHGRQVMADTGSARWKGRERTGASDERLREAASGPASELCGAPLAHAWCYGRGARNQRDMGAGPESGPAFASTSSGSMGNADHGPCQIGQGDAVDVGRRAIEPARGCPAGNDFGLFPPGPADLDGWRVVLAHSPHLEPAVRRMADGVAARLDLSGPHAARVDRLRLLGNGVVWLQAAYAFRTLVTRLAGRGSAGAAELARMMEAAEC